MKMVKGAASIDNFTPGEDARRGFPYFEGVDGQKSAFFDTAASALKPARVVDRIAHYLKYEHANIHRGAYRLSAHATELYEQARDCVAKFLNLSDSSGIVFTRGTTESINLVASSWGSQLSASDTILLSEIEHHSNIVPWQLLAEKLGLNLEYVKMNSDTTLDLDDFEQKLERFKPAVVSLVHISNSFGTINPLEQIISKARQVGSKVLVDAAQSAPHQKIDIAKLDPDFLVFSGHKLYGPTGIGVLYARPELLAEMPPYQGGGGMIQEVNLSGSSWALVPQKFEAGTPAIAEAVGLQSAIEFVESIGFEAMHQHEQILQTKLLSALAEEDDVTVYGSTDPDAARASIVSFNLDQVHPHDFATVADSVGVQVRAGHHCTMPAMQVLGISGTVRASLGVYNTENDISKLLEAIAKARKLLL